MKTCFLSALVLLLVAALLRADPPGVVERFEANGGNVIRDPTRQAIYLMLPRSATDDDLAVLCELRGLKSLVLFGTRVTDAGLRTIAGLPQAEFLALLGDTFPDDGLRNLEGMRGLREIRLGCPNVTAAGVERLRKALPDCYIDSNP
jgi:hypothetical protein